MGTQLIQLANGGICVKQPVNK